MCTRRTTLFLLLVLLIAFPAVAGAAKVVMPPGSFITEPVKDAEELARLVELDDLVARRYAKHFGMDAQDLAWYFRDNLKLSTLNESGKFTMYYIAPDGRIVVHKKWLRAGTKIFVDFTGQPIMDVKCGNPFVKTLRKPAVKVKPIVKAMPEPPPPPTPPVEVAQVPPPVEPVEKVLPAAPMELLPAVTSSSKDWVLPVLVGGGMLAGGGGGSSEDPVPEPGALLALGMGAGALLFGYHRRRG